MSQFHYSNYQQYISQMESIEVSDGRMSFIDVGEGEPILLIHGVPNSSWCFRKVIDELCNLGYRVIAPDLLGFGNSDKPFDESVYHSRKQADRILELMASLKIKSWTHICHDAGGIWTWDVLLKEPARVQKLVILNTIIFQAGFNPPIEKPHGSLMLKLMTKLYCSPLIGPMIATSFLNQSTEKASLTKEEKIGYLSPLQNNGHYALNYFFGDFKYIYQLLGKLHEVLKLWQKPVLVIWGKSDKTLDGTEQIPQLVTLMKKSTPEIHLLENVGHLIMEDEPAYLAKLIATS